MAGLSAAWRLSEPGWEDRFESITIYQRGWRLGGKGASSRGPARADRRARVARLARLLRERLRLAARVLRRTRPSRDRSRNSDPNAGTRRSSRPTTWPWRISGVDDWLVWPGRFSRNDELPGEPDATGRELTVVGFLRRALQLLLDFADSLDETTGLVLSTAADPTATDWREVTRRAVLNTIASLSSSSARQVIRTGLLAQSLDAIRQALDYERRFEHKRYWLLLALLVATARGLIADNLVTRPARFQSHQRRGLRPLDSATRRTC